MLTKKYLLLFLFQTMSLLVVAQADPGERIASIRLYNPTDCDGSSIVEVPVGDIATPGLLNWRDVKLICNGEAIPFSIQEGMAHWKSMLIAPVIKPRAEDLMTFIISVPPHQWLEVELVPGRIMAHSALSRRRGELIISYPGMRAVINERTGLLTMLDAFGESLLDTAMSLQFFKVGSGVVTHEGAMGGSGGPNHPKIILKRGKNLQSPKVRLASWSSTATLTEVNFIIRPGGGPAIGLTYKIYANHQVEILSDERPWQGTSPWLDAGLQYKFSLDGTKELLPDFQTHYPFYGYKDYASVVKSTGLLYRGAKTMIIELGEESINGRFWHRKMAVYPVNQAAKKDTLLSLLNDGLVVNINPLASQPFPKRVSIVYPEEIRATGKLITQKLKEKGFQIVAAGQQDKSGEGNIKLNLVENPISIGISGDGFRIQHCSDDAGIEVKAGTILGLFRGASRLCAQAVTGDSVAMPLISQNPVVDLRAGGFGGGTFEVDLPYGNDSVWKHVFSNMITTGMNVMTDQGMWSDWQMPVYFKYMPALQSTSSREYDPVSGVNFSQIADRRAEALKMLKFLHTRGIKVWLWIPIGAIPTTFGKKFPEATMPGNMQVPRFTSTEYQQYLHAYFKELLETYPVDGFVLIRDDNGGIDTTREFRKYIADSKTKDPVWEQYLTVYNLLKSMDFKGDIAVYPYGDLYEPKLDAFLPKDMMIVGHGSGLGVLTHNLNTLGTMGDTWLDNLYAGFRVPASGRMKRLLSDRGSYWIGGAYRGAELPWDAIGYFGWQPTVSVNTFRYDFGVRTFGKRNALDYVEFSNAYEHLWEIMELWLLPSQWVRLSENEKTNISQQGRRWLVAYYQQLNKLKRSTETKAHKAWFTQVGLYGTYFNYHLRRLELLTRMQAVILRHRSKAETGQRLPDSTRKQLISMNNEVYVLAHGYDQHEALVPGKMMASLRANKMTLPFKEWVYGYDGWLDNYLTVKQFAGNLSVQPVSLTAGRPFELKVVLQNTGCMPWMQGVGQEIVLKGDTSTFHLPARWIYTGSPMVFGDKRIVTIRGIAPKHPAATEIKICFIAANRNRPVFLSQTVELKVR